MVRWIGTVTGALLAILTLSPSVSWTQTVSPVEPRPLQRLESTNNGSYNDSRVEPVRYGDPDSGTTPYGSSNDSRANLYESAGQSVSKAAAAPAPRANSTSSLRSQPTTVRRAPVTRDQQDIAPVGAPRVDRARVSKGSGQLPNDAGQVWREYDLRPYTARISGEAKPQQRVVDWILRETGYEAWHSETFGILNADRDSVTVYHTPAMQAIVADIVDRFVNGRAADRAFSMRIMTVRNPDWRVKALGLMTPINVQSPGLQGWMMPKENHALLMSELARRSDVRDYNAANQLVANGHGVVFSTMRPRGYVKGIIPTQNAWPGYQPDTGQIEEGASLEFNPLLSMDLNTAEAVVKLRLNQIEKMCRVTLDLPAPAVAGGSTSGQRLQIEVPQMTMANLHERFRWPANQVLVLSMGMVATPGPEQGGTFNSMLPNMMKSPPRADALLFVEARNSATPAAGPNASRIDTALRQTPTFSGRY